MTGSFMEAEKKKLADVPMGRKPASAQDIKVQVEPESTLGLELMAWFETNKKLMAMAAGVVLLLVVIWVIYDHWDKQNELRANEALLTLRPPITGPDRLKPVPGEKYLAVVESHPGTWAAKRALIMAGEAYFIEGKYEEARRAFSRFLAENPGHSLASQADLGIAVCLDAQNKIKEAIEAYDQVRKRYSQEPIIAAQSRLAMARIYETQGDFEKAHNLLREMTDFSRLQGQGYNSYIEEASMRMFQLEKKHPELAAARMAAMAPKPAPTQVFTNPPVPAVATNAAKTTPLSALSNALKAVTSATNPPLSLSVTNKP